MPPAAPPDLTPLLQQMLGYASAMRAAAQQQDWDTLDALHGLRIAVDAEVRALLDQGHPLEPAGAELIRHVLVEDEATQSLARQGMNDLGQQLGNARRERTLRNAYDLAP